MLWNENQNPTTKLKQHKCLVRSNYEQTKYLKKQTVRAENSKLFCHYFSKLFNYLIENNSKLENIYNIDENGFLMDCNKHWYSIVGKSCKNPPLVLYNSRELVTVIEPIYANETKLTLLMIF